MKNMKTIYWSLLTYVALLAMASASNAALIFKGDSGASLLDYSNYYDAGTSNINISSYLHDGTQKGFYVNTEPTPLDSMPGYDYKYPWIGIGEFSGIEAGCSPLEIVLPTSNKVDMGGWYSGQRIQTVFPFGGGKHMTISLGSKDTSDTDVTHYTATFRAALENADSTVSVVRAADASQTTFQVNADHPISIYSGTVNFGTKETGALDKVTGANVEVFSGAVLNTYIKNLYVYHKDEPKDLVVAGVLNFQVAELVEGSELITVTGSCSTQGGKINFDFTDFEVGDGTYDLINAAGGFSLNGTPDDDLSMDFGIVGLEKEYELAFNADGTILQLTVVPEPAEIAALLGGLCLVLAAFRRRR